MVIINRELGSKSYFVVWVTFGILWVRIVTKVPMATKDPMATKVPTATKVPIAKNGNKKYQVLASYAISFLFHLIYFEQF